MAKRIEDRLWLAQAQGLLPGADDKIIHKGCGDRPSMFIKNDSDKYWAYCHRCRGTGFKDKQVPRIKQKVSAKTGWMPEEMTPLILAIVEQPYNFRDLLERFGLAPFVTLLKFSPDTKRVYFPDESQSYLGLDATFKANARFYSPVKRNLAYWLKAGSGPLLITGSLAGYLASIYRGIDAVLVMNPAAEKAALAALIPVIDRYSRVNLLCVRPEFKRDVKPFM